MRACSTCSSLSTLASQLLFVTCLGFFIFKPISNATSFNHPAGLVLNLLSTKLRMSAIVLRESPYSFFKLIYTIITNINYNKSEVRVHLKFLEGLRKVVYIEELNYQALVIDAKLESCRVVAPAKPWEFMWPPFYVQANNCLYSSFVYG